MWQFSTIFTAYCTISAINAGKGRPKISNWEYYALNSDMMGCIQYPQKFAIAKLFQS